MTDLTTIPAPGVHDLTDEEYFTSELVRASLSSRTCRPWRPGGPSRARRNAPVRIQHVNINSVADAQRISIADNQQEAQSRIAIYLRRRECWV